MNAAKTGALLPTVLFIAAVGVACDGGGAEKSDKAREAAAQAMLGGESVHSKAQQEDEERRKAAFAARKAKEDAEQARVDGIIAGIVGLPEKMPKDLDSACYETLVQYEEFVKKVNQDDPGAILKFYDNKGAILGERKQKCVKVGSVEAAACQAKVLAESPEDFKGRELDLLRACVEKYAPNAAAKSAPVAAPE